MTKEQIKQEILTKDLSFYVNKPIIDLDADIAAEYYNKGVRDLASSLSDSLDAEMLFGAVDELVIKE